MSARIGSTGAAALLRATGLTVRGWEWRGAEVLAVYIHEPADAWSLATMVHAWLGAPRWDWCGGDHVAYWPDIPWCEDEDEDEDADVDADPECVGVHAT